MSNIVPGTIVGAPKMFTEWINGWINSEEKENLGLKRKSTHSYEISEWLIEKKSYKETVVIKQEFTQFSNISVQACLL